LKVGDEQPLNSICHGVRTTMKAGRRLEIVALTNSDVLVHQIGRKIDHAELNDLIGKVQKPRDSSDSGTNPKIQKLVAKLYALPVPDEYTSQVEYVRSELTKRGIYKGESWVRQTKRKAK